MDYNIQEIELMLNTARNNYNEKYDIVEGLKTTVTQRWNQLTNNDCDQWRKKGGTKLYAGFPPSIEWVSRNANDADCGWWKDDFYNASVKRDAEILLLEPLKETFDELQTQYDQMLLDGKYVADINLTQEQSESLDAGSTQKQFMTLFIVILILGVTFLFLKYVVKLF